MLEAPPTCYRHAPLFTPTIRGRFSFLETKPTYTNLQRQASNAVIILLPIHHSWRGWKTLSHAPVAMLVKARQPQNLDT